MCSGENIYGIVAGLIAAAAILMLAFAEKHGGHHDDPHTAQHALSAIAVSAGNEAVRPAVRIL